MGGTRDYAPLIQDRCLKYGTLLSHAVRGAHAPSRVPSDAPVARDKNRPVQSESRYLDCYFPGFTTEITNLSSARIFAATRFTSSRVTASYLASSLSLWSKPRP